MSSACRSARAIQRVAAAEASSKRTSYRGTVQERWRQDVSLPKGSRAIVIVRERVTAAKRNSNSEWGGVVLLLRLAAADSPEQTSLEMVGLFAFATSPAELH